LISLGLNDIQCNREKESSLKLFRKIINTRLKKVFEL
jgi:hypothetical protein